MATSIEQLLREREHLFLLHEALIAVERAEGLPAKLRIFAEAIRQIGFQRVVISLRNEELDQTAVVAAGLTPAEETDLRMAPAPGHVWRRLIPQLERFRISQSFYLDGRDDWVARELGGGVPSRLSAGDDPAWSPKDSLLVLLKGNDGTILGTLILDDPSDRVRPTLARVRIVELFGHQVASCIQQARLVEVARDRAGQLQRLQEVGGLLARSLDEREIIRELARQVPRIVPCEGVVIAHPDVEEGTVATALRMVRGVERVRTPQALGAGPLAEVARTGRAVRIDDYDPERVPLASADDVVGDGGPAGSVLVVPMRLGIRLLGVLAVHATQPRAFGEEDEEVLVTIASHAATAIANARLYAESQGERRQSEALADVARAVSESLRLDEVLQLILRHATALLRAEGACVALEQRDETLTVVAGAGNGALLVGMELPVAASLSGRVIREGTYRIVNDALRDPMAYPATRERAGIDKAIIVPLISGQGAIGVLSVLNRGADFADEDARVLQRLADQVGVAIVNARLFEEVAEATREWTVAFDAIASGMVVLDAQGRVLRCNARAIQLAGVDEAEALLGRSFPEAVLGESGEGEDLVHRAAIRERRVARGTHRVESRGRIYSLLAAPHPNGGAVVTFDDVTAHHILAERYRLVIETTNDAIVITDRQRRIAFANPAAVELLGRHGSLIGTPVRETVHPDHCPEVQQREAEAFVGRPQRYETVVVRPDGDHRIVSVSTAPLTEVGEVTGVVASLRDVTAERRARDAVAQSEARYRNLFESATDAIYTLDLGGAFTSVNRATCDISGYPREELLGRSSLPVLDPADVAHVEEHFRATVGGESRRYECHFIRRNGERALLSVTNTPIRHGSAVVGVLGVARDVTEERRRAEALARSEARYTRLVESASDAIFTVDEHGAFTSLNRSLEESVGRPRDELLGVPFTDMVDPRDREGARQVFLRTMQGERTRLDFRYQHSSGDVRHGSIITTPILEGERVVGALGVVRDTTEERRLTEQLLQQEKLAAIGQLVSGVAHELNNPLAGVMAFSQLLLATDGDATDQQSALETIHAEAKRAAKIVANLLTFARQHQPERRATDINQVLLDTLELRRYTMRVQQIEIDVALDPGLPITWADQFQLQQVFLNLITNAEQALSGWRGEKRIVVRTWREGDTLLASVRDTGAGIEPGKADQIFNPFFTTKPVGQGTGLGLSISDGIVREHGGRIRVTSRPGEGATFVVELPWVRATDGTPEGGVERPQRSQAHSILIVDDEPAIRSALSGFLASAGHIVEAVGTGAEGIERLRHRRYDAVLLDLRMPDMSGDAVYSEVQRCDPEQAARIVFITGDLQSESARAFIRASGRPCLRKPFMLEEVASVLFDGVVP